MSGRKSLRWSLLPCAVLASTLLAGEADAQYGPIPSTQEILKTARAAAEKMPSATGPAAERQGKGAPSSPAADVRKVLEDIKTMPAPQWNVYHLVRATYYKADDIDAGIDLLLPRILELVGNRNFSAARSLIEAIGKSATVFTPSTGIPGTPRVRYKPEVDARLALAVSYID